MRGRRREIRFLVSFGTEKNTMEATAFENSFGQRRLNKIREDEEYRTSTTGVHKMPLLHRQSLFH